MRSEPAALAAILPRGRGKAEGGQLADKDLRINEQIRVREVRLVDDQGEQKGIVPTREAIKMARDLGLDLVEVAPQSIPPVCKVLNYGKFKFEPRVALLLRLCVISSSRPSCCRERSFNH